MITGNQTVDWLFNEQLQVDEEWAIPTSSGFTWWPNQHAQTIEVIAEETGPNGEIGHLVSVSTELLHNVDLTDRNVDRINALLMPFASMAGPVYDEQTKSLYLCSSVMVHGGNRAWINPLISMAAALQIGEASIMAEEVSTVLGATPAKSGHPKSGRRIQADDMAGIVASLVAPLGRQPSQWDSEEFEQVVDSYMQRPPSLGASAGGQGFTVEFPFGDFSSLCQANADQLHPRYGNGLLVLQSFRYAAESDSAGARFALSMNITEFRAEPSGYGFGSYAYRDNTLYFSTFFPNAVYRPNMLPNIYFASANRANAIAIRLTGEKWTEESFSQSRSALGRLLEGL